MKSNVNGIRCFTLFSVSWITIHTSFPIFHPFPLPLITGWAFTTQTSHTAYLRVSQLQPTSSVHNWFILLTLRIFIVSTYHMSKNYLAYKNTPQSNLHSLWYSFLRIEGVKYLDYFWKELSLNLFKIFLWGRIILIMEMGTYIFVYHTNLVLFSLF